METQPDVFVVPINQARDATWKSIRSLLLVVEVLSPSTARADRLTKRRWYQEANVPLYWIIDREEQSVEVWTPKATAPVFERKSLEWHPAGTQICLQMDLRDLFRPV